MQKRDVRLVGLAVIGLPFAVATLFALFWPGPLALDDRIPLALLFGVPAAVVAARTRREFE